MFFLDTFFLSTGKNIYLIVQKRKGKWKKKRKFFNSNCLYKNKCIL